jgi:hypothetical protein
MYDTAVLQHSAQSGLKMRLKGSSFFVSNVILHTVETAEITEYNSESFGFVLHMVFNSL